MVANKKQEKLKPSPQNHIWSWLNLLLTAVLVGVGIWYIAQRVTLAELVDALKNANPLLIILSCVSIIVTLIIKAWRWQLLLSQPDDKPAFAPLFWAFNLGSYVNLILPFLRMGEIARLFAADWMVQIGKARALGTIVVEKILDLMMLALTLLVILPFVILPEFVENPLPMVTAVSLASGFVLYILAFHPKRVIHLSRRVSRLLPSKLEKRVNHWFVAGLEGLNALHHQKQIVIIISLSLLLAFSAVLSPFLLFSAFHLKLGLLEAALLNLVVTLAIAPPSTPGKIGILNGTTALVLLSLGIHDEAVLVSYSTVYYLVIVLPIITFGSLAVSRTKWKWQRPDES